MKESRLSRIPTVRCATVSVQRSKYAEKVLQRLKQRMQVNDSGLVVNVSYVFMRNYEISLKLLHGGGKNDFKKTIAMFFKSSILFKDGSIIRGVHKVRVHFKKFITLFVIAIEKICKMIRKK